MPRRSTTRASNLLSDPIALPQPSQSDSNSDDLALLRRQWRWAAFSQFFCTFSQLFAMNDVTVADIEKDLVYHTDTVIPRVMQRLLYSLSYDRKVSVQNWQSALRKQYIKRDPQANPLGMELKDSKYTLVHEEETMTTESKPDVANSVDISETIDEHAPTTSHEASEPLEHATEDTSASAQQSITHSRQSSVAGNRAASASPQNHVEEGTEFEKPVDWFDLPLLVKLETIHTLTEWQFQNPTRLRTIMKSDDDTASWRIEPIGYDSKRNAYWFIGTDRLWIQRVPPRAPKPKALKRKRAPEKSREKAKADLKTPTKRVRLSVAPTPASPASGRHSRAAKDQAKLKLDVQARELAELNRQASMSSSRPTRSTRQTASQAQSSKIATASAPPRALGTRTSARLRAPQDEDEWQAIPDEWLNEGKRSKKQIGKSTAAARTGLESDDDSVSDLTELSDDGAESPVSTQNGKPAKNGVSRTNGTESKATESAEEEEPEPEPEAEPSQEHPENFVEWETICATLEEWEHIAERFEKATHYTEKALYKVLVNNIVPVVTHELKEIKRKREAEEALIHRKRSSRLAVRENEREEARLAAKRQQEEDEKMSRARRMEARQQKEEAERLKREKAREQRRQEREAREESRKTQTAQELQPEPEPEPPEPVKSKSEQPKSKPRARNSGAARAPKANGKARTQSGSRTPAGEDWELTCEICQRRGINLDDGTPMMSCGHCHKWQHILCHDRADKAAGRPLRNWDAVEFICRSCRIAQQERHRDYYPTATRHQSLHPGHNVPQMQPYRSYQPPMHGSPVDPRSAQYMPSYRDTTQQSYYVRPANGQPLPPPGRLQPAPSYPSSSHPQDPAAQPTISFSHYQPAAHGFSSNTMKALPDPRYSYNHSSHHQSYHNSAQQYIPSSEHPHQLPQQYRSDIPPAYKPQPSIPSWNSATPTQHTSAYPATYNGVGPPVPGVYRTPSVDNPDMIRHSEPSQSSYARYPEQQYPSTQFKHHPASSYQPPLGGGK